MFSPSSKPSGSNSFLWTFPECPIRVHVKFQLIDRLRRDVLDVAPAAREVGGLLIGNESSLDGDVEISDYVSLSPGSEASTNFVICSESLTRAIQSGRAADRRVVGFYRTHLDQRLELRAEDLECIRSKFNNPKNVFLLIRPHDGHFSGGFFYWQDSTVVGGLTFPFSSAELRGPSWTTLLGPTPRPSGMRTLFVQARERTPRMNRGVGIGLIVLVAILIAVAGVLRTQRPAEGTSHALGLRVERALMGVVVAWNPSTPEIAAAKDANLLIWDGSSPPAFVRLNPAQLRSGRAFFTSISDRVEVRLDIIGAAGRARTESIVSTARTPELAPEEIRAPRISADNSAKQPDPEAKAPADLSPPVKRADKDGNTLAELSKSPEPPSAGVGGIALPQTFHSFNGPRESGVSSPIAEESADSTFHPAVPIRETRPEIPPQVRPLIQSDNTVEVHVRVSASGKVTAAKLAATKGPVADLLAKSAVNAALGWQFRPATQNGQAVASEKLLEFLFRSSGR